MRNVHQDLSKAPWDGWRNLIKLLVSTIIVKLKHIKGRFLHTRLGGGGWRGNIVLICSLDTDKAVVG